MAFDSVFDPPQDHAGAEACPVSAASALRSIAEVRFLVNHLAARAEFALPTLQAEIDQMHSQLQVVGVVLSFLARHSGLWNADEQAGEMESWLKPAIQDELLALDRAIHRLTAALGQSSSVVN